MGQFYPPSPYSYGQGQVPSLADLVSQTLLPPEFRTSFGPPSSATPPQSFTGAIPASAPPPIPDYMGQQQAYIDAIRKAGQTGGYQPANPTLSLHDAKNPLILLSILSMLAGNDPNRAAAIPQFLGEARQMKQQDAEAETRRRAIQAAQSQNEAQAGVQAAGVGYQDAVRQAEEAIRQRDATAKRQQDVADAMRREAHDLEMEKFRSGNRRSSERITADLRLVPDRTKDSEARAQAAERLTAEGAASYTPDQIAAIRAETPTVVTTANANAAYKGKQGEFVDARKGLLSNQAEKVLATMGKGDSPMAQALRLKLKALPEELQLKALNTRASISQKNASAANQRDLAKKRPIGGTAGGTQDRLKLNDYESGLKAELDRIAPKPPPLIGGGRVAPDAKVTLDDGTNALERYKAILGELKMITERRKSATGGGAAAAGKTTGNAADNAAIRHYFGGG